MVGRSSEVAAAVEGDDKLLHQKTIDIPFRTSSIRNLCTGLRIICIELYHQFQLGIFTTRRDAFPNLQPTTPITFSPSLSPFTLNALFGMCRSNQLFMTRRGWNCGQWSLTTEWLDCIDATRIGLPMNVLSTWWLLLGACERM